MNCEDCKAERVQVESIPYVVHEGMLARLERANKRAWVLIIILIALLFGTNVGWLWYESQVEDVRIEQDSGNGGYNNFIGNDGDIYNGEADNNLQETENGR